MATKKQSSTKKTGAIESKVTRIKAADGAASKKPAKTESATKSTKKPVAKTAKKVGKPTVVDGPVKSKNPLKAIGGYFAGAWNELKQVRWPNRNETWGLTVAVILFTAFFLGLIILLDYVFSSLFKLIIN